jgi:hypothetical protein
MVRTRATELDILEGSAGRGHGEASRGNPPAAPPPWPPVSVKELLATQNELMSVLVQIEARRGLEHPLHHSHQDMNMSYSDFLVTHPPIFSGAKDSLEEDDWFRTTESKFGLLHCTEYQKTMYTTQ